MRLKGIAIQLLTASIKAPL